MPHDFQVSCPPRILSSVPQLRGSRAVCIPPRPVALKHASSKNLGLTIVSLLGDLSCAPLFQCLETTFSNVLSGFYGNRENPALVALAVCL